MAGRRKAAQAKQAPQPEAPKEELKPEAPKEELKPGIQGEHEDPFAFLARLEREMKLCRLLLKAVRGGRFRGRKPNGDWWVTIAPKTDEEGNLLRGREPRDIRASTPVELVRLAAVARCIVCGCDTDQHATREPTEEEAKRLLDTKRCSGEKLRQGEPVRCGCTRTPDDIRKKQGSPEWMAERLAEKLRDADPLAARTVSAATVFQGLRGPEPEAQAPEA